MFVYEKNVDFLKCLMRSHDIILEDLKILSSDSAVEKLLQCLDFINCQKTQHPETPHFSCLSLTSQLMFVSTVSLLSGGACLFILTLLPLLILSVLEALTLSLVTFLSSIFTLFHCIYFPFCFSTQPGICCLQTN